MATQEDRSLSSGISIPRWIKTKTFDLEQNTFSPTELDDSFMLYYRNNSQNDALKDKNNLIESSTSSSSSSVITAGSATASVDNFNKNKPDFSKHTLYCQKFLQNSTDAATAQQVKYSSTTTTTTKPKPSGVDDGFKGEAAKCGTSVIRMAHQMVSGNRAIPGFNLQSNKDCSSSSNVVVDDDVNNKPPPGFNPSLRRGSKSLPASPLTSPKSSPKSLRRLNNKYFTGPFIVDNENHHGSWILSNLLSKRHTLSQSFGNIIEEEGDGMKSTSSIASSIDDLNENRKKKQVFVPQPSELREMNFWSPTSM